MIHSDFLGESEDPGKEFAASLMGLEGMINYAFNDDKNLIETSSMFNGTEWLIQIPTINGNPIVEVDLNDSNVKKVFKACDWIPGQPSVSNESTTETIHVSPPEPLITTISIPAPVATPVPAFSDNRSFAPSFDCTKASSGPERLICSDRDLAKLDIELNQAYLKSRDVSSSKSKLRFEQLEWIKTKRNACSDKACMEGVYRERISQLNQISLSTD